MNGNTSYRAANTALLSIHGIEAPVVVTSAEIDERMAETIKRLKLRPGLLQRVAGIDERRWYPEDASLAEAAATAGSKALSEAGVDPDDVGVLINTSITRPHLEPAVSVQVHDAMALPSSAMNFDITNACLGFVNGLQTATAMIDAGQVRHAVVVSAEDSRSTIEDTIARLNSSATTKQDYLEQFASLTLGSGAVAAVLGRAEDHPEGHRVVGGVVRSATQHHGLCVGKLGRMVADSRGLLEEGVELLGAAFDEAKEEWGWATGVARYILHQVSSVHTKAMIQRMGLDRAKTPLTFPFLGNTGSAALPMTLAREVGSLVPGDRVLCMGVGSGLNTAFCEIRW
ncbi:3-oxoacyl-ACP synthase III [Quadrisphaera sp. DSM 44207]|uniref:3-oxoacyl-ACP synthase III n=1 Tax=Quadrisphaera sp. DSM 44207 TaxID=1881057 RepID=UPI00088F4CE2|nr:3-oxoacyl-ACP synthase III [Quadrisphaera sp. DSM 44207]SDQ22535.1 3-oxoacyl-[acyl-carrier-protein] synthase-3 [Quadrisphaera sp. DSM 44207]